MDDATITRLCAEAIGFGMVGIDSAGRMEVVKQGMPPLEHGELRMPLLYDPLNDDAQAMALVKKLKINTSFGATHWYARYFKIEVASEDLNRAICECAAKMRNESHKEP